MDSTQLLNQAKQFYEAGRLPDAERLYGEVLAADRGNVAACRMLGFIRFQQQRHAEAVELLGTALKSDPDAASALVNYGLALQGAGRLDEALASFDKALRLKPDFAVAHNNRGNTLRELKRPDEALAAFDRALAIRPDHSGAWNNRGNTLTDLDRPHEALDSFDRALRLKPDFAVAWNNRGNVLKNLKRHEEALACYDRALSFNPDYADAFSNRGGTLSDMKYYEDALESFDRAIALNPRHAGAFHNRGNALRELKRFADALASLEQALALKPDDAESWYGHGITLMELNRNAEALESFDKVLALKPTHADAHNNRGNVLQELQRSEEAAASYEQALAIDPDHRHAFGGAATAALYLCDFARTRSIAGQIKARVEGAKNILPSFTMMGYCDEAAPLRRCSENYINNRITDPPPPIGHGAPYRHDKIRIAYLSSDFRHHPTSMLLVGMIESHDRERFECIGISFAPDDASPLRARIAKAFDSFHEVHRKTYAEVAKMLREMEVDIAIDLNGHTRNSYPEILGYRPAPVQVNFLGFPGTMGVSFMDYIIADPIVLPFEHQDSYAEQIVQLPDCYQPNDRERPIAARTPARAEMGLPETGFVFCDFNSCWKITEAVFDVWMRLLKAVPGSVLWLLDNESGAAENLRAAAAERGVDPARLVFALRVPTEDHLARHRLADLFLDTLPYNAHTTGADALWAGLPIVTCMGENFPGRVGASLLTAAGLPELITHSLEEYEALALKLAREPELLRAFRQRLAENRATCALFDTIGYTRHIEAAYRRMWERAERGESPQAFAV